MMFFIKCFGFTTAIIIAYFFEKRKNTAHRISFFIAFIFILLLIAGNYENADTHIYMLRYEQSKVWNNVFSSGQFGQALFSHICNKLGLSFQLYRLIFYALGLCLILTAVRRFIGNSISFLLMYAFFPMIIDSTQMKNFMAMSFLTLAISYLSKGDLPSKIIFAVILIIGSGFHVILLAYLPMLIFCNVNFRRTARFLSMLPIIIFSILFSTGVLNNRLTNLLLNSMDSQLEQRTERFLVSKGIGYGGLVYYFLTFLIIFIFWLLKKQITKYKSNYSPKQINLINTLLLCSVYSLAFMPLYTHAQDFSRLLRNFAPMIHICTIMVISARKRNHKLFDMNQRAIYGDSLVILGTYSFYLVYAFYWDISVYINTVVIPFFTKNWYF